MADLFREIIPSILKDKKNVLENEKDYNPYIVNRALSYHYDCILVANQMNTMPHLDRAMQYHYYLNSVRSVHRPYQKWQKKEISEAQELVKEYYKYSNEKAKEALRVLSDDQIDMIKQKLQKGGLNAKSRKPTGGKAR